MTFRDRVKFLCNTRRRRRYRLVQLTATFRDYSNAPRLDSSGYVARIILFGFSPPSDDGRLRDACRRIAASGECCLRD